METLYKYIDYHEWLRDLFAEKKKQNGAFSYRLLGSKVDLDPSFLAKVVSGKRELSPQSAEALVDYFELSPNETAYFQKMVAFSSCKTESEKQVLFDELLSLRRTDSRVLIADEYEFFSRWYYSAVRSLLQVYPFYGKAFRGLGNQLSPSITALQAKESIELLERLELITRDDSGRYILNDLALSTGKSWNSYAIRKYHQHNIDLGREAIDRFAKEVRDISGITMNIGRKDLPQIRQMIDNLRDELIHYVNTEADPEEVYHLNIQLFPFTKGFDQ